MFTGIIREVGSLKARMPDANGSIIIEIASGKTKPRPGDSIAVNGICLTVTSITKAGFRACAVKETLNRTNFSHSEIGARLNLEPSLRLGDAFDGHFVTGHIDTTCQVVKVEKGKNGSYLIMKLPNSIAQFVAEKGSIALNGVSLTVASVSHDSFAVATIPYTLKNTNLRNCKKGDLINVEADVMARYLYNLTKTKCK